MVWFLGLILIFTVTRKFVNPTWIEALHDHSLLIYSIFILSEVIFGIIPPEIFMMWSLSEGLTEIYAINILFLAVLSYGSGILGYFIGSSCQSFAVFQVFEKKYLRKYKSKLRIYGKYLVITSAWTPLPFSAIAMALGVFKYSFKNYAFYSLARFLRFGVYGFILFLTYSK